MNHSISMTRFAASIAGCLEIPAPEGAGEPVSAVKDLLEKAGFSRAQKLLIYNPDAVGMWLFQKYTEDFAPVLRHSKLTLPIVTVMPSVTPVCFGTMYTGVMPEVHGIQKYEKKLIERDSLFDRLAASSLRTALVAVEGSSMSVIFGGRGIDYFILRIIKE